MHRVTIDTMFPELKDVTITSWLGYWLVAFALPLKLVNSYTASCRETYNLYLLTDWNAKRLYGWINNEVLDIRLCELKCNIKKTDNERKLVVEMSR